MNRLVILLRGYGEWVKVNCQQAGGLWGRGEGSRICLLYSKETEEEESEEKDIKKEDCPKSKPGELIMGV